MEAKDLTRCPRCGFWTKAAEVFCWKCGKRHAAQVVEVAFEVFPLPNESEESPQYDL